MKEQSSFRDPSGHVFYEDGVVYRQVNDCYGAQCASLMESGLYEKLTAEGLLVAHRNVEGTKQEAAGYCVIAPERVPFITYPYEWSFSQLKDAALTTLRIHRAALDYGMILKDASAYNIQFVRNNAKLIDTLSFEFYEEGSAWVAYGQFCRHFVAPLLLMKHVDLRLQQLLRVYIDGVPLDLASKLLKGKHDALTTQHIHWHAKAIARHTADGGSTGAQKRVQISKFSHIALIESLERMIERLTLDGVKTEWMDYYDHTNYTQQALARKEEILAQMLQAGQAHSVWDLGANDGSFSRIALENGAKIAVAFDIDPLAVEQNYLAGKRNGENIVPLLFDLTNPSPGIGFGNTERVPAEKRMQPDCIIAFAIIHHLAISNNLPLGKIAEWMAGLSPELIIEFVPKEDSQVQTLLATRDDVFPDYTQDGFERAFGAYFDIAQKEPIAGSGRTIYRLERRAQA